jgi:Multicopper oxidase
MGTVVSFLSYSFIFRTNLIWDRLGVFDCDQTLPEGQTCDNSSDSYAIFNVNASSRYRFRLIDVAAFADFQFSIDEHVMQVKRLQG